MRHLDEGSLQAWLDRSRSGLGADEVHEIERHLAACAECAKRAEELDGVTRRVRSLLQPSEAAVEPIPEYREVVARAGLHRDGRRRRRAWTAAAWAASVVAALGVGWFTNDLSRGSDVASPVTPTRVAGTPSAEGPAHDSAATAVAAVPQPAAATEDVQSDAAAETLATEVPRIIRGRVTDESGRPLSAAQVLVQGTGVGTVTQQDGTFSLALPGTLGDAAARDVKLTAMLIGFSPATRDVVVPGGDTVSADLRLAQQAVALDEIVVTGVAAAPRKAAGRTPEVAGADSSENVVPWADAIRSQAQETMTRAEAEKAVGFALLTVPDLDVVGIRVGYADGVAVVSFRQPLQGGEAGDTITLVEYRVHPGDWALVPGSPQGGVRASIRRGDIQVNATARVDSLKAILDRVR